MRGPGRTWNDGRVHSALPSPVPSGLLTAWTWQPLALVAALLLGGWYAAGVRRVRRSGRVWPGSHVALFAVGLGLFCYATCGMAGAYLDSLFWVWTSQQLALLLVVPYFILAGQPLRLARTPAVQRVLHSRALRLFGNPLIGPALVPVLCVALFFGPLPAWSIAIRPLGWVEQLLVVLVGGVVVLPLTGVERPRSSLAVGLSLAIGSFELVLDAVPGMALRLHNSVSTSYFAHRAVHPWTPGAVHDQQLAGSVLWCVAELLDLPFLVLVFRQWLRADARDAADIDAVLEAERIARGSSRRGGSGEPVDEAADEAADLPWWLNDPGMQDRLGRRRD